MTNGAKLATPTLATAKAGEQYPALPQFQHVDEEQPRNCLSCLGRTVDRSRRELHPRKSAPAVSDILDDRRGYGCKRFTQGDRSHPARLPAFRESEKDRVLHLFATTDRDRRGAGYRTSLFGKTALHRRGPDIRKFEHVLNSYGLDDVDEIRAPRASVDTICHMTARWESLGLLEAFRNDIKERVGKNKTLVRPSPLPLAE
jgi:hypothetical protein